eukprot:TRINITY_DN9406_c0_g1_i1.p1 TRINITY_DN9406_c0_g1~~TRINITY_DN9406_c0_g1_i1.p1  ORF type:complete len:242 (-),score=54.93 TRINITY_DN9406_c0_g1_i1:24-749(-)
MSEVSLKGTPCFVTGGSSGMGQQICIWLAKEGCNVAPVGRDKEKLDHTVSECKKHGVKVVPIVSDLSSKEAVEKAINQCVSELGGLGIVINGAGIGGKWDEPLEKWEEVINTNLLAVLRVVKIALPHLEKYNGRKGIINISSVAGIRAMAGGEPYTASKHGVTGFTASLFEDVREKGIKVCSIEPGYVNTPMVNELPDLDPAKMIQSEDIAQTVLFVLKYPETGCPTEIVIRPQRDPKKEK